MTEPVQVPAAGKASVRLCIFLGTTINGRQGTNVALLVPVLMWYPKSVLVYPHLVFPCCAGSTGALLALVQLPGWCENNQPTAVVEPSFFSKISERYGTSEMQVPTMLMMAVVLKYKIIFFSLGTKEFYAELTE